MSVMSFLAQVSPGDWVQAGTMLTTTAAVTWQGNRFIRAQQAENMSQHFAKRYDELQTKLKEKGFFAREGAEQQIESETEIAAVSLVQLFEREQRYMKNCKVPDYITEEWRDGMKRFLRSQNGERLWQKVKDSSEAEVSDAFTKYFDIVLEEVHEERKERSGQRLHEAMIADLDLTDARTG